MQCVIFTAFAASDALPPEIRQRAVEVNDAIGHIMNAVDLRVLVPTVCTD
jgi:hypothetical protein